jgi:hypothetical protein
MRERERERKRRKQATDGVRQTERKETQRKEERDRWGVFSVCVCEKDGGRKKVTGVWGHADRANSTK